MRLFPIFLVLTCEAAISILNAIYQPIMAKAIFLSAFYQPDIGHLFHEPFRKWYQGQQALSSGTDLGLLPSILFTNSVPLLLPSPFRARPIRGL